jgi:cysteine-rich repeat protein
MVSQIIKLGVLFLFILSFLFISNFETNSVIAAVCGDCIIEPEEQCEDGNTSPGDGCSADCLIEECGNGIVDPGEECDDGNDINSDSCTNYCRIIECTTDADCSSGKICDIERDKKCKTPCNVNYDCQQGEWCYYGKCSYLKTTIYHCNKPGCPPGKDCIDSEGNFGVCGEDTAYECQDACDCGPAHGCIDISGVGKRCIKDVNDLSIPGGTAIYNASIPDGEPTYCCADGKCFIGWEAYGYGSDFVCYDRYTQNVSNFCGGKSCYWNGDCLRGESCVDTSLNNPVRVGLCDQDVGRCVSKDIAEAIFGYEPDELWPVCEPDVVPLDPCTAGWKPGGAYTFQQEISISYNCGNEICDNGEYPGICPEDCYCGDGACSPSEIGNCNADCGQCGDGVCDSWETPKNCLADCSVICGDGSCDSSEVLSCQDDCICQMSSTNTDFPSVCGDGFCHGGLNSPENCITCPQDCEGTDCDGDNFCRCEGESCGNIDCNDADNQIYPGAFEICDGKDNDCDGVIPNNEIDDDSDGMTECEGDCNDADSTIYAGAEEFCDGKDNDCDSFTDEGFPDFDSDQIKDCVDPDDDNDTVIDENDNCPYSLLSLTVAIENCDSGVENHLLNDGCTILDRIADCAEGAKNHGQFMSCVDKFTNNLKHDTIISGKENGMIDRCAEKANIP